MTSREETILYLVKFLRELYEYFPDTTEYELLVQLENEIKEILDEETD